MKNLSLTLKIIIIFFIPVLALIYFSFYFTQVKYQNLQDTAKYKLAAKIVKTITKLTHNIQLERGLSAGYIVSKDKENFKERLIQQYKNTNKSYADLLIYAQLQSKEKKAINKEVGHNNITVIKKTIYQWNSIDTIRDQVLNSKISFDNEILYYSRLNSRLLHMIESYLIMLKKPSYDDMALAKLQYLKENAGLERAYIYNAILSKNRNNIEMVKELQRSQTVDKRDFILNSSISTSLIYSQTLKRQTVINLNSLRDKFLTDTLTDQKLWFDVSSNRINMLESISTQTLQQYIKDVTKVHTNALYSLYFTVILWLLSVISLSFLIYMLRKLIANEEKHIEELRISAYTFDSHEAMTITDVNGIILKVNNGFTRITGYTAKEAIGKNPRVLKSMKHGKEFYKDMWYQLNTSGKWSDEIYNMRKNGEIYPERLSITAIKNNHDVTTHYIAQFLDISDLKKAQEKAEHQADHDFLTGLSNRKYLMSRLNEEFIKARRHNFLHAFLFLDLDNFKKANDTYGHGVGDLLIKEVANKLKSLTREEDVVARVGGDEFAIMILNIDNEEKEALREVKEICNEILNEISSPFIINEHRIEISASIGIKLFPDAEKNVHDVIVHADTAMYQAKNQGKNQLVFFDKAIEIELKQLTLLEEEIQDGLKNSEFELYFQPKVNVETGLIYGAELLSRWNHPRKGLLFPNSFIEVASDIGLIHKFTLLALHSACKFIKKHDSLINGSLAINITSGEILKSGFSQEFINIIEEYGINPAKIELEITEDDFIKDFDLALSKIIKLKEFGFRFAIDDFGTGYSSITYLKQLPVDTLKIDRSFLQNLNSNQNRELLNMIIQIAHTFRMSVVVEGIEDESQLKLVQDNNAQLYQGFYFSRAVTQDSFLTMLYKS